MISREDWLNGWHRQGAGVLMGTTVCCAGCGKPLGLACVALGGDEAPKALPDWPFNTADCPVCMERPAAQPEDRLTARLLALKARPL